MNYISARFTYNLVLRVRASRNTDRTDDYTVVDQWNSASGRDDSVESEQIVQMAEIDAVLEDPGTAAEDCGRSGLVLRDLNRSGHRTVHSLEGDRIATGVSYRYVHFPPSFLRLGDSGLNNRLRPIK